MSAFAYRGGELFVEEIPLASIAKRFGTPAYVYSRATLESNYIAFDRALSAIPHLVCYAMKANANLAVLNVFATLGSGFDIVSQGELARVIAAGGDPARTLFSGVGKTTDEMRAALTAGVHCFNVESASELARLANVAAAVGRRARIGIRVNPDVDPRTHRYIATGSKETKFGVAFEEALPLYRHAASVASLDVIGIDIHLGSQITELEPFREATRKVLTLVDELARERIVLSHVDVGGGLGIRYRDEVTIALPAYANMLADLFAGRRERVLVEPGRRLVGDAGVLVTRVDYLKRGSARNFAIVDAAMNDLIRPALYDAWHPVDPVRPRDGDVERFDIVGPVCESADFLARDRMLSIDEGDLLAIGAAGAYAMAMSSNYNARPRPCEVLVDGEKAHLVRRRETIAELFDSESLPPSK
ncbi:MAG TPA: diaminopimelate decarboxylase [Casimicrobiaceae bacterium]|nr:diaminopimelate decarboxylase [Casimicrobiaceae bacterium]